MKVRATRLGYYDHRRIQPGEIFELKAIKTIKEGRQVTIPPTEQFSERWMETIDGSAPPVKTMKFGIRRGEGLTGAAAAEMSGMRATILRLERENDALKGKLPPVPGPSGPGGSTANSSTAAQSGPETLTAQTGPSGPAADAAQSGPSGTGSQEMI